MKKISLTRGKFALVDDEDFERLNKFKWCAHRHRRRTYASREIRKTREDRKTSLMHREILQTPDGLDTDHIDGNGLNNQKSNLRVATRSQNQQAHRLKEANCSSRYRGVNWHSRDETWQARIQVIGKRIHLGYFDSELAAARAYNIAAIKYFGKFASPNFFI